MINNFVKFEIKDNELGTPEASIKRNSIVFKYPCSDADVCSPYKITLSPGTYKIECWGSKGKSQTSTGKPGLGAYTKGSFAIFKRTVLYGYVGATGRFNSVGPKFGGISGGGATDVRLQTSELWNDTTSLKSRIMVAAGGGGAEWPNAIGGNGGELEGGESISSTNSGVHLSQRCKGANQTSGSACPRYELSGIPYPGVFGTAKVFASNDYGGFGGGGYYAGTSYNYAYAGSGGSSFISGHEGCVAVKATEGDEIEHTDNSFHYSGFIFRDTEMIGGNKTMPLPSGTKGKWEETHGAIRISLISFNMKTLSCRRNNFSFAFMINVVLSTR